VSGRGRIRRHDVLEFAKKAAIWLFVVVFLTSILGVAIVSSSR